MGVRTVGSEARLAIGKLARDKDWVSEPNSAVTSGVLCCATLHGAGTVGADCSQARTMRHKTHNGNNHERGDLNCIMAFYTEQ